MFRKQKLKSTAQVFSDAVLHAIKFAVKRL
jgi:hypothetical protein